MARLKRKTKTSSNPIDQKKKKKQSSKPRRTAKPNAMPSSKPRRTVKPSSKPRQPRAKRPQPIQNKNTIVLALGVTTPLDAFFSQYPNFQHQPSNSPVAEFDRLCEFHEWERHYQERKDAREEFQNAMREEFNGLYGSDENDIGNWYKLCHVLGITPLPDTLPKCRAAVHTKHVNLVDLVHGSKVEVRQFKTVEELSEYTKETEKFFPKESARDGGVLRALRRHILTPHDDSERERLSYRRVNPHTGSRK
ncbi:hypothetical protein EI94DRAFT_1689434 [Lactarius quietus]|nr:hypothetical protein EI94DRAFT_1689434 [Lactarius quietus]